MSEKISEAISISIRKNFFGNLNKNNIYNRILIDIRENEPINDGKIVINANELIHICKKIFPESKIP